VDRQRGFDHLLARVVSFIVLAICVDLWMNHHLGIGLKNPGRVSALVAAVTGALALVDRVLEKQEKESIVRQIWNIFRNVLSVPVLAILYVVAVILGLTYSSIMIIPETVEAPLKVTFAAVESPMDRKETTIEPKGAVLPFVVRTNPFGRPYRITVNGYLPETFDVYPLVGVKVIPGRQLRRSPSVILRPPIIALRSLEDGGSIVICGNGKQIAEDKKHRGSFLLGRAQPIPTSYFDNWKLELVGAGLTQTVMAQTLLEWNRPKVLSPKSDLEPGMTLVAKVLSKANNPVAQVRVTLGSESLVDVPMIPVEE
jgi:hypothetical protein